MRSAVRIACAAVCTAGQMIKELIAADASHDVLIAHRTNQSLRDDAEEFVARIVTESFVDGVEVVEVYQDHSGSQSVISQRMDISSAINVDARS